MDRTVIETDIPVTAEMWSEVESIMRQDLEGSRISMRCSFQVSLKGFASVVILNVWPKGSTETSIGKARGEAGTSEYPIMNGLLKGDWKNEWRQLSEALVSNHLN